MVCLEKEDRGGAAKTSNTLRQYEPRRRHRVNLLPAPSPLSLCVSQHQFVAYVTRTLGLVDVVPLVLHLTDPVADGICVCVYVCVCCVCVRVYVCVCVCEHECVNTCARGSGGCNGGPPVENLAVFPLQVALARAAERHARRAQ